MAVAQRTADTRAASVSERKLVSLNCCLFTTDFRFPVSFPWKSTAFICTASSPMPRTVLIKLLRSETVSQTPFSVMSPKLDQKAATSEVKMPKGCSFGGSRAAGLLSTRKGGAETVKPLRHSSFSLSPPHELRTVLEI